LSSPGLAFATAISSVTEVAGTAGCTTSMLGATVANVTGEKSRTGSTA